MMAFSASTPVLVVQAQRCCVSRKSSIEFRPRKVSTKRSRVFCLDTEPKTPIQNEPSTSQISSIESLDGTVSNVSNRDEEIRGHVISTLTWVAVAAACTPIVGLTRGWNEALEFVTAYVVEYSLSVDNLFVFLLIFGYFNVPDQSQKRVLTWGILGAMVMRGAMIIAGTELTRRFELVTLVFAALLMFSAFKLLVDGDDDDGEDLSNNGIVKFARRLVQVTDKFDGDRFFTIQDGVRMATPLFLVLVCVELSDIVFALDSVPAVLGISDDTVVIYLSNILAIMGLRNLFFILAESIGGLRFLSKSLAIVLGFVGCKMVSGVFGYEVPILPSLAVIVGTLGAGIGLSFAFPENKTA